MVADDPEGGLTVQVEGGEDDQEELGDEQDGYRLEGVENAALMI